MSAWEYRVVTRGEDNALTKEELNAFGEAEFELVSVAVTTRQIIVIGKPERKSVFHYFFKRPARAGEAAIRQAHGHEPRQGAAEHETAPETPAAPAGETEPASPV